MKGDIIPNGEFLYKYVNPKAFPENQEEIPYGIFEDRELSCDWERYQKSPERSFHIKEGKNLVIRISVCDEIKMPCNPKQPRQQQPAWEQKIEHDPISKGEDSSHPQIDNFSHSLIKGLKKIHITKAIAENSKKYKLVNIDDLNLQENKVELGSPNEILSAKNVSTLILLFVAFAVLVIIFLRLV